MLLNIPLLTSDRNAVKFRFVDIWRVNGLPSVYFATQLTVGPVGGRYLISKMTFDKGGLWKKVKGPDVDKYNRPCRYVSVLLQTRDCFLSFILVAKASCVLVIFFKKCFYFHGRVICPDTTAT